MRESFAYDETSDKYLYNGPIMIMTQSKTIIFPFFLSFLAKWTSLQVSSNFIWLISFTQQYHIACKKYAL